MFACGSITIEIRQHFCRSGVDFLVQYINAVRQAQFFAGFQGECLLFGRRKFHMTSPAGLLTVLSHTRKGSG